MPVEEDPEPESICYTNAQLLHNVLAADDILAPELKGRQTLHNNILIAIEPLDDPRRVDALLGKGTTLLMYFVVNRQQHKQTSGGKGDPR